MRWNRSYWVFSTFFFVHFFGFSSVLSLFGIWLGQAVGLDGTEKGIVFAINSLGTLCFHLLYGYISDKIGLRKYLLSVIIGLLLLAGPFFQFIYGPLLHSNIWIGAITGSLYMGAAFSSGNAAIESFIEKISRLRSFEYGKARMFGSLGWAVATFFAGQTFNVNPNLNFWVCTGTAMLLSVLLLTTKLPAAAPGDGDNPEASNTTEPIRLSDIQKLGRNPRFWAFVMYIFGVMCLVPVYDQQFPVYFSSLFESKETGNRMYGYLNSVQVFAEALCMFLAPALINKIGPKRGLLLGGLLMFIRISVSGIADGPLEVGATKLIQAFELPVMLISIFKYIRMHFEMRVSSTMYLVGYQFTGALGGSVMSPLAGKLYDQIGFPQTYLWMAGFVCLFTLIAVFTLSGNTREAVQGMLYCIRSETVTKR
ncbi:oligosaccharide MFS transporter [Paenibacillus sp. KQZ6P-2]|uniref:Oligosaccharide MFS transporter n=1 Tax=Paenibacillus mangrovi TaxID=2931978 RepID=A0A9X1WLL9_9BACL|nr:oligosaccharide MFS transporter [Paenibacillus mangrovi]MCJ8010926.1 oligosaccharide MFS transporter [Paenibacillus mangrovi]